MSKVFLLTGTLLAAACGFAAETARIQAEIDAAAAKGGGRVVIAKGVHECGTLHLKSGVELHLEEGAVLRGGDRSEDYEDVETREGLYPEKSKKAFIVAEDAHDIAITGKGVIDGQGAKFFDPTKIVWERFWAKPPHPRPRMIQFARCRRVRLEDTTFLNSPCWTMWLRFCDDVTVSRIRIEADPRIINSDGIDFDACRRVRVGDSFFRTGDDCLILRAMRGVGSANEVIESADTVVSNCVLDSACQGVRIGCPSDDTIRDAVFRDITCTGHNGIISQHPYGYLKPGDRGYVKTSNLVFENWKIACTNYPVWLFVQPGISLRDFGHFTFRNFQVRSRLPFTVTGCAETVVKDVTFENVTGVIEADTPFVTKAVEGLVQKNVTLASGRGEPTPFKGIRGDSWETVKPGKTPAAKAGWSPRDKTMTVVASGDGETMAFAVREARRLFGRVGVTALTVPKGRAAAAPWSLQFGKAAVPSVADVRDDGFAVSVASNGVVIAALGAKGVLNGLYTLAEEAGFAFLYPGEKGELAPAKPRTLAGGVRTVNPRFAYRGFYDVSAKRGYTYREWMEYLAKNRFNAISQHVDEDPIDKAVADELGFRCEQGGHGLSACLPRELFKTDPELFRMLQPDDFGGKRAPDSNLCISHPRAQAIVAKNFVRRARPWAEKGFYAVHAWADDLPGNGWCMCPRCRAMEATDQSMLAMNVEARAIRAAGLNLRVPVLAYHDTAHPSELVDPDPLCFFLFAPRERCWAHALNDPNCALNAYYLKGLEGYARRFAKNTDAHTFEYYTDTMLTRGHASYQPALIAGDADAYEKNGVKSWMTVHIGGPQLAIEWNLLAMAHCAWERGHTADSLTRRLVAAFPEGERDVWRRYLDARADAYGAALQLCDISPRTYFDYRFMPERGGESGRKMVRNLERGAAFLREASAIMDRGRGGLTGVGAYLADKEAKRIVHECTDMDAMVAQQKGLYEIAEWRSDADPARLTRACERLREARALVNRACDEMRPLVMRPGEPDRKGGFDVCYYLFFVQGWLLRELDDKIRAYSWRQP